MADLEEEGQPKRSFKVEDRRRFSETGEARPAAEATERPETEADSTTPPEQAQDHESRTSPPPVEMNFSTFVISLSTQALAHLGEIPDPIQGRIETDLVAAKQLIDILGILKEKTGGNLDDAEAGLLEHCLYDLRVKYVEVAKRRQGSAP